jgi:hypothetical protein
LKITFFSLLTTIALAHVASAALITSIPGPDDQGGMLMPMVTLQATSGMGSDPTAGILNVSFAPPSVPALNSLEFWSPGDWFADGAAWRTSIGSPAGVGATPVANAGAGDLFNNQYGFMFMGMGTMMMANIPTGKSLGIKLSSVSSSLLESYNYSSSSNRWDQVFPAVDSQVLWNGSMWHNYFTLPASAPAGTYTATFSIFIADTPFTGTTGFAQYDAAAAAALADPNFTSSSVTYTWTAVPEPSTVTMLSLGAGLAAILHARRRRS